jgi:outer membrane protein assembly factor BamE (lipoprotein component of BamABCDE complex)
MRHAASQLLLTGLLALLLAGCETQKETRGYMPDEDRIGEVRKGVHDRNSVESLLGSPSATSTFDNSTWYYITSRTEKIAFLDEDTTDQQVVAVVFDKAGIVADLRRYTLAEAREIEMVERETPTRGRELTIVEQLVGNFGRFNTAKQR